VFGIGLLVDLLTGTPYVGISSLIFLLARAAVMSQRKLFVNRTFPIVWLGFLVLTLCAFLLLWALVSVLHGGTIGIRPFAFQAVLTVACYPVGSYLLARAHRMFLAKA
jgi:rod shape-determining protein MreD